MNIIQKQNSYQRVENVQKWTAVHVISEMGQKLIYIFLILNQDQGNALFSILLQPRLFKLLKGIVLCVVSLLREI